MSGQLIPITIDIYMDCCHMSLNLPVFFETSKLMDIRRVFKMAMVEPERNEEALEKLQQFLSEWEQFLKNELDLAGSELDEANKYADDKWRGIEEIGQMVIDEDIVQAKRRLRLAKTWAKDLPDKIVKYEEDLERVMRPKTDYVDAAKAVKWFEKKFKHRQAILDHCSKIIKAYNRIQRG